jgi:hypothetical protein
MAMPKRLIAGDAWSISLSDSAWPDQADRTCTLVFGTGTVRLSAPGKPLMTGPVSGPTTWLFGFLAADTAALKAGTYRYDWLVFDNVAPNVIRNTAQSGLVPIAADPAGTDPVQPKGIKRLQLDAGNITLLKLLSGETSQVTFQGHQYTLWDIEKLKKVLKDLEGEVEIDEIVPGGPNRNLIYTRFRKI